MARRIRIAVLGTGNIAGLHVNAVRAHADEAGVVAVADDDGDRVAAFRRERGSPPVDRGSGGLKSEAPGHGTRPRRKAER